MHRRGHGLDGDRCTNVRYSLKKLLIVVGIAAVVCGFLAHRHRAAASVKEVIAVANKNGYVVLLSSDSRFCALVGLRNDASWSDEVVSVIERATGIEAISVHIPPSGEMRMSVAFHRCRDARGYTWWVRDTVRRDILNGDESKMSIVPNQFRLGGQP